MIDTQTPPIDDILEIARRYPSPHNSQPIMVRTVGSDRLKLYYNLDHGLPAESFGVPFGYVCVGVFLASLGVVAEHFGYGIQENLELVDMDFNAQDRNHYLGEVHFIPQEATPQGEALYQAFLKRQTSRIPYNNQLVSDEALQAATKTAEHLGYVLHVSQDASQVDKIIAINQQTLFLDLENDAVHSELMQWLRFSEKEARQKADGLSAKTMLINGRLLRFMIVHRRLWRLPIIGSLIRRVYLNTMRGVRQVAWLTGSFATLDDYVKAGRCFMYVWLELTKHNVYLHPYGTVITNPQSHKAFVKLVGQQETQGEMAWMLFRLGYSKKPPTSYRRPSAAMLLKD